MKRIRNLYPQIWDIENIKLAHKNARKGKTHYKEVKMVDADLEHYCELISDMLKNKKFVNSEYQVFTKKDKGKERTIYKLPYFPDRIIHHAILQVLEPIWKKSFIPTTYQSIKGRGVHKAKKDVEKVIRKEQPKYYLQMDIAKFYPSVNNQVMKEIVVKKIKCRDTLWLLNTIIDSVEGLPIGNYLSQYLGNLYLTYFDHWVKEDLKAKYYYRYCDDLVILSDSKNLLGRYKHGIEKILRNKYFLKVKSNVRIEPITKGLDYLGFVFYNKYTLLRQTIANSFKDLIKKIHKNVTLANRISSYYGWVKVSNSYNLWRSQITDKLKNCLVENNNYSTFIRNH